jgi:hypothetical protein
MEKKEFLNFYRAPAEDFRDFMNEMVHKIVHKDYPKYTALKEMYDFVSNTEKLAGNWWVFQYPNVRNNICAYNMDYSEKPAPTVFDIPLLDESTEFLYAKNYKIRLSSLRFMDANLLPLIVHKSAINTSQNGGVKYVNMIKERKIPMFFNFVDKKFWLQPGNGIVYKIGEIKEVLVKIDGAEIKNMVYRVAGDAFTAGKKKLIIIDNDLKPKRALDAGTEAVILGDILREHWKIINPPINTIPRKGDNILCKIQRNLSIFYRETNFKNEMKFEPKDKNPQNFFVSFYLMKILVKFMNLFPKEAVRIESIISGFNLKPVDFAHMFKTADSDVSGFKLMQYFLRKHGPMNFTELQNWLRNTGIEWRMHSRLAMSIFRVFKDSIQVNSLAPAHWKIRRDFPILGFRPADQDPDFVENYLKKKYGNAKTLMFFTSLNHVKIFEKFAYGYFKKPYYVDENFNFATIQADALSVPETIPQFPEYNTQIKKINKLFVMDPAASVYEGKSFMYRESPEFVKTLAIDVANRAWGGEFFKNTNAGLVSAVLMSKFKGYDPVQKEIENADGKYPVMTNVPPEKNTKHYFHMYADGMHFYVNAWFLVDNYSYLDIGPYFGSRNRFILE